MMDKVRMRINSERNLRNQKEDDWHFRDHLQNLRGDNRISIFAIKKRDAKRWI